MVGADRRRRAAGGAVGARGRDRGRRANRAQSPDTVIAAWFGLLFVPPVMAVVAIIALPWLGVDLNVNQPAQAMAQFFGDSFQRRIGAPLRGRGRRAAHRRPGRAWARRAARACCSTRRRERSPWVTARTSRRKARIVVWPTTDTAGAPPEESGSAFPISSPEVPRPFDRKCRDGCRSCASAGG